MLAPGGAVTAIEVDYNSVWSIPTSAALQALFEAVARTMDANGRSDTGRHLEEWLVEAGFGSVDPGERRLAYSNAALARQVPYVVAVVESTLAEVAAVSHALRAQLEAGVEALRALPAAPDGTLGWAVYKAHAVRP